MKKVWTCVDFEGFWPGGSAAVCVAESRDEAWILLDDKLRGMRLPGLVDRDVEIKCLNVNASGAYVLCDGS